MRFIEISVQELSELRKLGLTTRELAKHFGVAQGTIRDRICKNGLERKMYASGERHSKWKGGLDRGLNARARLVVKNSGRSLDFCETCGDLGFCVHHIDGNVRNNVLSNLRVLCRSCHQLVHGRGMKLRSYNKAI